MDYLALLPYANTDIQRTYLRTLDKHNGSTTLAAKELNKASGTIGNTLKVIKNRAALKGWSPDHDMTHATSEMHVVKGVSSYYGENGELLRQWVKTDLDKNKITEIFQNIANNLSAELPTYKPTDYTHTGAADLMAVYPIGDPHIGMLAIADEAGEDWTLESAREIFPSIFGRAVNSVPHCKQATIVNLGDYFHADNVAGVTTRSGHNLDTDKNFLSMADIGVEILLYMIQSALGRHESVRVINAIGNHDDTGAMFLQVLLKHMYKNEPRVQIDVTASPFNFVRFGKCFFGVHHGHTTKADKLPLVMATDRAKDWGEAEFRYWYTGHIHHDTLKEYSGCKVESFRTLAAKDAYAAWGGYRSGQDTKAIVLDREFGEVERHTINIKQHK